MRWTKGLSRTAVVKVLLSSIVIPLLIIIFGAYLLSTGHIAGGLYLISLCVAVSSIWFFVKLKLGG